MESAVDEPQTTTAMNSTRMEVSLFDKSILTDDSGTSCVSGTIPVALSTVGLSAIVVNAISLESDGFVSVSVEGSYDGRNWLSSGLPSMRVLLPMGEPAGPIELTSSPTTVAYAFLRARLDWSLNKGSVLVRAITLILSKP